MKSYKYFELNGNEYYSKNYLVSIALCTRKNVQSLQKTINSFVDNADSALDNYEFIIKVDFDDNETLDFIKTYSNNNKNVSFIINSNLEGYASLGEFWKDCTNLARGKYIMITPDDSIMQTPSWNKKLESHLKETKIYFVNYDSIDENGNTINVKNLPIPEWAALKKYIGKVGHGYWDFIFPIYPKKLIEIWGFISPHAQIDFWLGDIAKRASTFPWNVDSYYFINDVSMFFELGKPSNYPYTAEVDRFARNYINSKLCFECIYKLCSYRTQEILNNQHQLDLNYVNK